MELIAEKTKLITNSANGIQREINVKGQKLGTVTTSNSSQQLFQMMAQNQRFSRTVQATAALTKLKPIWRENNISLESKVKLMPSPVISIFLSLDSRVREKNTGL